ncbi:ABC transporter ATP-binding protein [Brachybacterium tyrofermentans]|uniref:ABC transporter ATP-binding protein n=1 Tax=Brachybacterium tyrofermentans TaxID=47848 RepID=A0ABW0FI69_9MICO
MTASSIPSIKPPQQQNVSNPNDEGSLRLTNLKKIYPGGHVGVHHLDLDVRGGELLTLLGPSGCGKTTTLRMIAGFETVTSGSIELDGLACQNLAPNKRPMAMVFQSYALFPHMSVIDNVRFGMSLRKLPRAETERRVAAVIETMGLTDYVDRFPNQLSGGQQQRVALARAVVIEPKVLLFDEPLSNLDAKLRGIMRGEIRNLQKRLSITSIFVTHDQDEAMTMSDRIVVMNAGRIEQVGSPEELYRRPATRFVADFLGKSNFVDVDILGLNGDKAEIDLNGHSCRVANPHGLTKGRATALIRPESVGLGPAGDERDGWGFDATISEPVYFGSHAEYTLRLANALSILASVENPHAVHPEGTSARATISTEDIWLLPDSGAPTSIDQTSEKGL